MPTPVRVTIKIDPAGTIATDVTGAADHLTLTLSTYPTVTDLVAKINTISGYAAVLLTEGAFDTSLLDEVKTADAVNLFSGAYTVKAGLQAVIDWIDNSSELCKFSLTTGVDRRLPLSMTAAVLI